MRHHPLSTGVLVVALVLPGCRRTGGAAEALTQAPTLEESTGQAKCGVRKSADKPLIVEWPAADRAALESRASRGLVAVRYEGCEMEILTTCTATGQYDYVGLTQKREGVRITNADELYAKLPVGAAGLEAKLERAGQLNVDMAIVGRREANANRFTERDLEGRCDEATHVVTGLTVGAFSFYTGAGAEVGGAVTFGNAGVGASSAHEREILKTDGDQLACATASSVDVAPPEGCGALLRVEVVPVDRIFASAAPTTSPAYAATSPSPSSPHTQELDRKIQNAERVRNYGIFGLLGVSALLVGAGVFVRSNAKLKEEVGMDAVSSERQKNLTAARAGIGLMAAGGGLTVVGLAMVIAGARRANTLKAQRGMRAHVRPTFGPGTLGLTGRF
jgi:hypothetical protein